MKLSQFITTGLGSGLAPKAPGTFGTAAAAIVWFVFVPFLSSTSSRYLTTLGLIAIGIWTTHLDLASRRSVTAPPEGERKLEQNERTDASGNHHTDSSHLDPKEIVIDEWAGLFVTYSIAGSVEPWSIILGFAFFRFFDISKVGPVGAAEKLPGAWGIMLDDVVAGVLAGLMVLLITQVRGFISWW